MLRVLTVPILGLLAATQPAHAQRAPLPEVSDSWIEYPNVASAWEALSSRDDIEIRSENGWQIVIDQSARTIWSFSPPDYPAYPAVVKRQVVPVGNRSDVRMSINCEASKEACDNLVIEFQELLDRSLSGRR